MSIRKVNFVHGEYYHIYNRGNSKQKIFHDTEDYLRFISLLYVANTTDKFNLYDVRILNDCAYIFSDVTDLSIFRSLYSYKRGLSKFC